LDVVQRARGGKGVDSTEAVVIVFQRLLVHDAVPAAGKSPRDKIRGTRFAQLELDGMAVAYVDRFHRREQGRTWTAKTFRGKDDTREGGVHIVGREVSPVVELHTLAQEERGGLAVWRDLPALSTV